MTNLMGQGPPRWWLVFFLLVLPHSAPRMPFWLLEYLGPSKLTQFDSRVIKNELKTEAEDSTGCQLRNQSHWQGDISVAWIVSPVWLDSRICCLAAQTGSLEFLIDLFSRLGDPRSTVLKIFTEPVISQQIPA